MAFTPETKWNADDQKIKLLMEIETSLEESFLNKDAEEIYDYLGAYRRQSYPKFKSTIQTEIDQHFKELEKRYLNYCKDRKMKNFNKYYSWAEATFLHISQKIKEAGIYYREGKNASHAILDR
jgi:hypothetical protein